MTFLERIAGELGMQPTPKARRTAQPAKAPWGRAFGEEVLCSAGRCLVAAYMRLLLDVDIQWQAPLPEGPKILAANHPTTTDPFYILTLLSEPVSVLVTEAAFNLPLFGGYLRAAGHVPAVRGSGGAAVDAVAGQVAAGRSVAIFPEGALSPLAGGFHRPHSGVARIALRTAAPVIPVGIGLQHHRIRLTEAKAGGEKAIGHFYPSGPYALTVGRPLTFEGDDRDRERVRAVAALIMNRIRNLAGESQRRIWRAQERVAVPRPDPSPV